VTPEGDLIDKPSGMQEGIVFANIDLKEIGVTRREWTFLRDRRPEVYWELTGLNWQRRRGVAGKGVSARGAKKGKGR
jgi:hypothetical protein